MMTPLPFRNGSNRFSRPMRTQTYWALEDLRIRTGNSPESPGGFPLPSTGCGVLTLRDPGRTAPAQKLHWLQHVCAPQRVAGDRRIFRDFGRVGSNTSGCDEPTFVSGCRLNWTGIILHAPSAVVNHSVPASRQTVRYFVKRCFSEGVAKGQITNQVGSNVLGAEKRHLTHTMPQEFLRGLLGSVRGDRYGVARSFMIVLGTAATGLGFARSVLGKATPSNAPAQQESGRQAGSQATVDFVPSRVVVVDVDQPHHAAFEASDSPIFAVADGDRNSSALCLTPPRRLWQHSGTRRLGLRSRQRAVTDGPNLERSPSSSHPRSNRVARALPHLIGRQHDRCRSGHRGRHAPSGAETREMIQRWNHRTGFSVTYIRCDRPGLANAHNAALPVVNSDIVAFTDDDVLIDPLWIDQIKHGFELSNDIACVTGAIMPAELDTWPQQWQKMRVDSIRASTLHFRHVHQPSG